MVVVVLHVAGGAVLTAPADAAMMDWLNIFFSFFSFFLVLSPVQSKVLLPSLSRLLSSRYRVRVRHLRRVCVLLRVCAALWIEERSAVTLR